MEKRKLGTSDLEVSVACLGTMTWGEQNTEQEAHQQLDYARERGINFIDTAEMYPVPGRKETQGSTERYLGTWLKNQKREDFIIATKVIATSGINWIRDTPKLSAQSIEQAIESSLKRLQTDYVDLYQIHWPDRLVPKFGQSHFDSERYYEGFPIEETLDALEKLVQAGKVRHIGVSNETPYGLSQYMDCHRNRGKLKVQTIQNAYNLLNRVFEIHLAENCFHEKISLLAYSPLAFGLLSGKYLNEPPKEARFVRFPQFGQRYLKSNVGNAVKALTEIAEGYGLVEMSLQFLKAHPQCGSVIIGATNLDQLKQNIDALEGEIPNKLVKEINKVYQIYRDPCP